MSLYYFISFGLAFCGLARLLALMRVIASFCPLESEIWILTVRDAFPSQRLRSQILT